MSLTRPMGTSGLVVKCIGLGGMPMSIVGRPPEERSISTILAALEAGMDFIDTADIYCLDDDDTGHNERLFAKALKQWNGHAVTVATKGGLERPGGRWTRNASPAHLRVACDKSLKALGVETIALYQLHAPDPAVKFSDSVATLAQLQKQGKIQHIGLSNVSVEEIRQAQQVATIVSVQNRCSIFERGPFKEGVVEYCTRNNIAFLPHSPVGGHGTHQRVASDKRLTAVAARHNADPYQVALAWLLAQSPVIIPIPGASRPPSARSSAKAMDLTLTPQDLAQLA